MNCRLIILICSIVLLLFGCSVSDREAERYVSKNYKVDSIVTMEASIDEGNMGSTSISMMDENGVEFDVDIEGFLFSRIVGDDYEISKKEKELTDNKIKFNKSKIYLDIKKIGYDDISYNVVRKYNDDTELELYLEIIVQGTNEVLLDEKENLYGIVNLLKDVTIKDVPIKSIVYENGTELKKYDTDRSYSGTYKGTDVFNTMILEDIQKINNLIDVENRMLNYSIYEDGSEKGQIIYSNMLSKEEKYINILNKIDKEVFPKYQVICGYFTFPEDSIYTKECTRNVLLLYTEHPAYPKDGDDVLIKNLMESLIDLLMADEFSEDMFDRLDIHHEGIYDKNHFWLGGKDKGRIGTLTNTENFVYSKYNYRKNYNNELEYLY